MSNLEDVAKGHESFFSDLIWERDTAGEGMLHIKHG